MGIYDTLAKRGVNKYQDVLHDIISKSSPVELLNVVVRNPLARLIRTQSRGPESDDVVVGLRLHHNIQNGASAAIN